MSFRDTVVVNLADRDQSQKFSRATEMIRVKMGRHLKIDARKARNLSRNPMDAPRFAPARIT